MISGDLGRSCFAAVTFSILFKVLIPYLSRFLWIGFLKNILGFNLENNDIVSSTVGFADLWSLVLFFFACFFIMLFPTLLPRGRLDPQGKGVLITGCDTGFGLLLAKRLHEIGMTVYAGCLLKTKNGEGSKELMSINSSRMHVLQLDVTSSTDVDDAITYINLHLPPDTKGLWGVVNNAGASAFGEVEWSSIDLYKSVSEVNIWGVVRCTKACLPSIRRTKGRVVNMTSGLARMMAPSRSVYGLTKYAIQGFSDCLRYEMKSFGVKVSMIEPGNYIAGTNIFTKKSVAQLSDEMWRKMPKEVQEDYGREWFEYRVNEMKSYCNMGMKDLSPVISAYEDALLSRNPLNRYQPMSAYWTIRSFVFTHFPSNLADYWYIYRNAKK